MGIYFPNAHLQFYSNNFGWLLLSLPFLRLQQPLCIYSREHNVTFVFSRTWPRRLCSCKWIQVLRPTARSGWDTSGSGSLHARSPEPQRLCSRAKQTCAAPPCIPPPTSVLSTLKAFSFLELPFSLILCITFSDFYGES